MPYEILPDLPEPEKKPVTKPQKTSGDTLSLFEKLLVLVIAWKYFHFTGKAIAEGKKIPKDWLAMRDRLLPTKVRDILSPQKTVKPPEYKVVDLATKQPINIR